MALTVRDTNGTMFDLMSEGGERWVRITVGDAASAAYPSGGYALPPSLFAFQAGFMRRKLGGSGDQVVFPIVVQYQKSAAAPVADVDPVTGNLKFFTNAGAEVAANTQVQNQLVVLEAYGH